MGLAKQGTTVIGVYPGPVDTRMAEAVVFEKTSPEAAAVAIVAGIEAGTQEIFPDPMSQQLGGLFNADPKGLRAAGCLNGGVGISAWATSERPPQRCCGGPELGKAKKTGLTRSTGHELRRLRRSVRPLRPRL